MLWYLIVHPYHIKILIHVFFYKLLSQNPVQSKFTKLILKLLDFIKNNLLF